MSRTNLVPNGGFESNFILPVQDWVAYHGSVVTRDTGERVNGSYSAKVVSPFSGPSSSDFGLYGAFSLADGAYTHSAYVKGESTAIGKTITIYLQEGAGTAVSVTQQYVLTGSWQRMSVTRIGFNGGLCNLFYIVQDNAGIAIGDTFYIDGVQVEAGGSPTEYIETDGRAVTVGEIGHDLHYVTGAGLW